MSASHGRLQSLAHPPGVRVTQKYMISQFNTVGRGRCGHRHVRGQVVRSYGCVHGCGGRGGHGGRRYVHNPSELSRRYGSFVEEARIYPVDQWIILSSQQKNNIE